MMQHSNRVYEVSINFLRIEFVGDPDPEYVFPYPQYCTYQCSRSGSVIIFQN
jgi:hypothetical protein